MRADSVIVCACVLGSLLAGCSTVGPAAIRSGRLAYNEAIAETNRQQILMAVVHNRYQEEGSLLGVSSITANISFSAGTGVQWGAGDSSSYAGNLVPLSATASYEESPTISYTPAAGERYLRQVMSPLPLATVARIAETALNQAAVYDMLVASMNGIHNPGFQFSDGLADPRFVRLVALMKDLARGQMLHWVDDPNHRGGLAIYINHYAPAHSAEVNELMQLLGLDALGARSKAGTPLLIPVTLALGRGSAPGIAMNTRSLYRLVEILSAAIELPPSDQRDGVTQRYPAVGGGGSLLRVHWSAKRPEHATVAVKHRDGWFYIADDDAFTKRYFRLLGALWSVTVAESTADAGSRPVLTVPVGR